MTMSGLRSPIRVIILLAALGLTVVPAAAIAQGDVPAREGNIWNGVDHEPVPSEVHRDEEAAGIAPPRGQQQNADDDIEEIYHQLMRNEAQGQP
jgi:hypothetical protein